MNEQITFVLYVECKDKSGEKIALTFFDAVVVDGSWLINTFLPAAAPVLGITEITEVYYLDTRRIDIIKSESE